MKEIKGYYLLGKTYINGQKYLVYENELDGCEDDWLLVNVKTNKKMYKHPLDVILV